MPHPYDPMQAYGPFQYGFYGPIVGQGAPAPGAAVDPNVLAQMKAAASTMQPDQQKQLFEVSETTAYHKKQINIQRAAFAGIGLLAGAGLCMLLKRKGRR